MAQEDAQEQFVLVCSQGLIEKAQDVLAASSLGAHVLDDALDDAFVVACFGGHMKVAQWPLSNKHPRLV
jgi:hypothetical protein